MKHRFVAGLFSLVMLLGITACGITAGNESTKKKKVKDESEVHLEKNSDELKYGVFLSVEDDLQQFSDYNIIVIDAQYFSKEEIEAFQDESHVVYSYINVGSIEDFRPYYDEYVDLTLGDYENWEEEKWVDVSSEIWQDFILEQLAPELLGKGIDGFFVDNCDVYYNYETDAILEGLAVIMKGLIGTGKDVIINGGDAFLDAYTENLGKWSDVITGINQETVLTRIDFESGFLGARDEDDEDMAYFQDYVERYAKEGAKIFLLEYSQDPSIEKKIKEYCSEHGFYYYLSDTLELGA